MSSERRGQVDKPELMARFIERYQERLARAEEGRSSAQSDANAHKGAMQSRYDTFKEEAQNLAAGQARRVAELRQNLALLRDYLESAPNLRRELECVKVGALVTVALEDGDSAGSPIWRHYFVSPVGDSEPVDSARGPVLFVSRAAPLGAALAGKAAGDRVALLKDGRRTQGVIEAVS